MRETASLKIAENEMEAKIRIVEILIIRMNSRLKKRKRDSLPEYLRLFSKKEAEQKNL